MTAGTLPANFRDTVAALRADIAAKKPKLASRAAGQRALESLVPALPELIGGSADLTGSNLTFVKGMGTVTAGNYAGRYIHYGIREHGMAAAMNGMAVHGGVIPYGGTFFCFTDYMRPSIRLAALMRIRVVYVLTHDSIGLGEDGPTHQPVEHLASLRAMPNIFMFRPGDTMETAECWELALRRTDGPSLLALSRQSLPEFRTDTAENRCARGAYVLAEADGARQATIIATGSEVMIAMAARDALAADGIKAAVVSLPCWELFAAQDESYRAGVLGGAPRVARRGRRELRLGQMARPGRHLHRPRPFRRIGAVRGRLQGVRHHPRSGGGGGEEEGWVGLLRNSVPLRPMRSMFAP